MQNTTEAVWKTPFTVELTIQASYEQTYEAAVRVVKRSGLNITSDDAGTHRISAEAGRAGNSWGELVEIQLDPQGTAVRLRITSTAKSNLGTNRHQKHLTAISKGLAALLGPDAVLSGAAAVPRPSTSVTMNGEVARAGASV